MNVVRIKVKINAEVTIPEKFDEKLRQGDDATFEALEEEIQSGRLQLSKVHVEID
jgi:hypothetical protein